jgi:hypothetical protein
MVSHLGYALRSLTLTVGPESSDVLIKMTQFGVISGRVVTPEGQPISDINIYAQKAIYSNGQRSFKTLKRVQTNDLGEYRLFGLMPGRYFVSAGTIMTTVTGDIYPTLYYPNTTDSSTASSVSVHSGTNVSAVDFVLRHQRPSRIRGKVIDGATGLPAQNVVVTLHPRDGGTPLQNKGGEALFEFADLLPGSYDIHAIAYKASEGVLPLEVGTADLDNVSVLLHPPVGGINGRFIIEGRAGQRDLDQLHVQVLLRGMTGNGLRSTNVRPDGTFTISSVPVGEDYRIEVSGMPSTWYVKNARFGATEALHAATRVESGSNAELEIVASSNSATFDGVVVDDRQNPVSNATVVLVPDINRRQLSSLYRVGKADAVGRIHFEGVTPGDYKAFVWEDVEAEAWQDPEFIQLYESRGESVHFDESSKRTLTLKPIPSEL